MPEIHGLLNDRRIGIISAHPDDHLMHGSVLWLARQSAQEMHELVLTAGEATAINHRQNEHPVFDPAQRHRASENARAARLLGINTDTILDAPDGELKRIDTATYILPYVRKWLEEHKPETLLTLGQFPDHTDHVAAGRIGILAAKELDRPLDILALQPALALGMAAIEATQESITCTVEATRQHRSQFRIEQGIVEDWPLVGGYSIHPHSYAGLLQYPIWRTAAYEHIQL